MNKTVIIALALVGTLTAGYLLFGRSSPAAPTTDALKDVYNQWKLNYKINVGASEDSFRFGVFSTNYGKIQSHNALLGRSYNKGLNAFTHLTPEEFAATHFGYKASAAPKNTVRLPARNLTTKVDWSEKMGPVKDQGQCGSCWAFSTVGALEGLYATLGQSISLSEQELVDCSSSYGNQGCNGGLMDQGFQYVVAVGGLATEDAYPYTATDGDCQDVKTRVGKISGFTDVTPNSEKGFKAALAKQPLAVAIEADTETFQSYSSGIITDADGCGTQLDHGVTAVGYDDESKDTFIKVRNSWSTSWGENGHFRVAFTGESTPGMCGIYMAASYPTA